MINLIHGDDLVASRKKLDELWEKNQSLIKIDLRKEALYKLYEALEAKELFYVKKALLIENAFKLPTKDLNRLLEKISNLQDMDIDLVFWEPEKLKKTQEEKIKNAKVFKFILPQYYFELIDSLGPNNGKKLVFLYSEIIKKQKAEDVFYSIIRRIRLLILLKGENYNHSDAQKLSSWQITKIKQQARRWNNEELLNFYEKLFEIEVRIKSGDLPLSLESYIDILLLSL